jgi:uncharacterized protein
MKQAAPPAILFSKPNPYWPGWHTIGLTGLILFAMGMAAIVMSFLLYLAVGDGPFTAALLWQWSLDSQFSTAQQLLVYWTTAATGFLAVIICIHKRRGLPVADYLALYPVGPRVLTVWLMGTLLFYGVFVFLPTLIATQTGFSVPTTQPGFLYFVTIVVVAPAVEEVVFRGFMFIGLLHSRAGITGAIFISTTIWTAAHFRVDVDWISDIHALGIIFSFGIVLCIARIRTNSLLLPLVMHSSWNALVIMVDALIIALMPTH